MKKNLFVLCFLVAISAFAVKPKGSYLTWYGNNAAQDATGTGSSFYGAMSGLSASNTIQSCLFGMYAGYGANYITQSYGIGNYSMYNSRSLLGCVYAGFGAGQHTSFCTNCIFIGKNAGREMQHLNGAVIIGDVLVHTNGVTTIKGLNGLKNNGKNYVSQDFSISDNDLFNEIIYKSSSYGWYFNGLSSNSLIAHQAQIAETAYSATSADSATSAVKSFGVADYNNESTTLEFSISSPLHPCMSVYDGSYTYNFYGTDTYMEYENGSLNVYTNGVEAGTLIMKDQYVNSLPIKDEDTGEKYMIKIKSGELKLYKVND